MLNPPSVLMVPGLYGSGPSHWQSRWEARLPHCLRVLQRSWDEPERDAWVDTLQRHIAACAFPPVLVAHSLGCAAVAHLTHRVASSVRAALLVAPCDVEAELPFPAGLRGFAPLPTERLAFPSILVASTDDPYLELDRARELARRWGGTLVVIPNAGHINAAAGFGAWPQGERLLERLMDSSTHSAFELLPA